MSAGPPTASPTDVLTSTRFQEVLDHLRDHCDFVLLDAPALLAVSDARGVAARVDGVLLLVRIAKRSRIQAERATEILQTMKSNLLGTVINMLDSDFTDYDPAPIAYRPKPLLVAAR